MSQVSNELTSDNTNYMNSEEFKIKKALATHFNQTIYKKEFKIQSYEYINIEKLHNLLHQYKNVSSMNENQLYQLKKLYELSIRENGLYRTYYHLKYDKLGRYRLISNLGCQNLPNELKHYLYGDYYNDYDIKACQFNILKCLCSKNDIDTPCLDTYINNYELHRERFFEINKNRHTKKHLKKFINSLVNIDISEFKIQSERIHITPILKDLYYELNNVIHPFIKQSIYYNKTNDKLINNNYYIDNKRITDDQKYYSCLTFIIQEIERSIIIHSLDYLKHNKIIEYRKSKNHIKISSFISLTHDGFMVMNNEPINVIKLNSFINKKFGYPFEFRIKNNEKNTINLKCNLTNEFSNPKKQLDYFKNKQINGKSYLDNKYTEYRKYMIAERPKDNETKNKFKLNNIEHTDYKQLNIIKDNKSNKSYIEYKNEFRMYDTLFIKAKLGEGKSRNYRDEIKNTLNKDPSTRILIVLPKINLCNEMKSKFLNEQGLKFELYSDVLGTIKSNKNPLLICCLNSLYRVCGDYDIVIIDEAISIYKNLFCSLITTRRGQVYRNLTNYIKESKKLIIIDGLLNRYITENITKQRIKYNNIVLENKKTINKKKDYIICERSEIIEMLSSVNLNDGKLRVLCSNSKKFIIEDIKEVILKQGLINEKDLLIITSNKKKKDKDNDKDTEDNKSIQERLNEHKKGLILYSPTLESGNDIVNPVDELYCHFINCSNDADGAYQMTGRCRNLKTNKIYVSASIVVKEKRNINFDDIKKEFHIVKDKLNEIKPKLTPIEGSIKNCIALLDYNNVKDRYMNAEDLNLFIHHISLKNKSYHYFTDELIQNINECGHNISFNQIELSEITKKIDILISNSKHSNIKKEIRIEKEQLKRDNINTIKRTINDKKNELRDIINKLDIPNPNAIDDVIKLLGTNNIYLKKIGNEHPEIKMKMDNLLRDMRTIELYNKAVELIKKSTAGTKIKNEDDITFNQIEKFYDTIRKGKFIQSIYFDKAYKSNLYEYIKTKLSYYNWDITTNKKYKTDNHIECKMNDVKTDKITYIRKKCGIENTNLDRHTFWYRLLICAMILKAVNIDTTNYKSLNNQELIIECKKLLKWYDLKFKDGQNKYQSFNLRFLEPMGMCLSVKRMRVNKKITRKYYTLTSVAPDWFDNSYATHSLN
jgi:hypothetical protein